MLSLSDLEDDERGEALSSCDVALSFCDVAGLDGDANGAVPVVSLCECVQTAWPGCIAGQGCKSVLFSCSHCIKQVLKSSAFLGIFSQHGSYFLTSHIQNCSAVCCQSISI